MGSGLRPFTETRVGTIAYSQVSWLRSKTPLPYAPYLASRGAAWLAERSAAILLRAGVRNVATPACYLPLHPACRFRRNLEARWKPIAISARRFSPWPNSTLSALEQSVSRSLPFDRDRANGRLIKKRPRRLRINGGPTLLANKPSRRDWQWLNDSRRGNEMFASYTGETGWLFTESLLNACAYRLQNSDCGQPIRRSFATSNSDALIPHPANLNDLSTVLMFQLLYPFICN